VDPWGTPELTVFHLELLKIKRQQPNLLMKILSAYINGPVIGELRLMQQKLSPCYFLGTKWLLYHSCILRLSQIIPPYSSIERINPIYKFSNDFLSSLCFINLKMLILLQALVYISLI
jgi:hypothetical protein